MEDSVRRSEWDTGPGGGSIALCLTSHSFNTGCITEKGVRFYLYNSGETVQYNRKGALLRNREWLLVEEFALTAISCVGG